MSTEKLLFTDTLEASADLSSYQYYCIQQDSNGKAALANATSDCYGILQNAPANAGDEAEIGMLGISKAKVNGNSVNIAYGDRLAPDSNGILVKTDTDGDDYLAVALQAATADGLIISVWLVPFGQVSAPSE